MGEGTIGSEAERCPNASVRLANFSNERQGSRAFCKEAGVSIVTAGCRHLT